MKVEFKHNCEIQGKKFGFEKHLQPGTHEVPAAFIFDWFFVALVLDNHAKILEAHYSEFEEFSEEELKKIDPKFIEILSKFLENEDEEESDDEDESESEDDSSNSDDSLSDNEGGDEVSSEESEAKVSKKKLKKKGKR